MSIPSFKLLDGTSIPWLAWGSGTGGLAGEDAIEKGKLALNCGINHIDTAQLYKTEAETTESIKRASVDKSQVYVTSKCVYKSHHKKSPIADVYVVKCHGTQTMSQSP